MRITVSCATHFGKGLGCVALRDIKCGERLISEPPPSCVVMNRLQLKSWWMHSRSIIARLSTRSPRMRHALVRQSLREASSRPMHCPVTSTRARRMASSCDKPLQPRVRRIGVLPMASPSGAHDGTLPVTFGVVRRFASAMAFHRDASRATRDALACSSRLASNARALVHAAGRGVEAQRGTTRSHRRHLQPRERALCFGLPALSRLRRRGAGARQT